MVTHRCFKPTKPLLPQTAQHRGWSTHGGLGGVPSHRWRVGLGLGRMVEKICSCAWSCWLLDALLQRTWAVSPGNLSLAGIFLGTSQLAYRRKSSGEAEPRWGSGGMLPGEIFWKSDAIIWIFEDFEGHKIAPWWLFLMNVAIRADCF